MSSTNTIRLGKATSYTFPTDEPEADGTLAWNATTLVIVELEGGGARGFGYSYGHRAACVVARELIEKFVRDSDCMDTSAIFWRMRIAQRNYGREGIAATALSAIDIALWDLKAKLLDQPLCKLLGQYREKVPVYGSGGFTSYTAAQLSKQLEGWVSDGIPRVKMKVGTDPERDPQRVHTARQAIGHDAELFVDANGAYSRKQALRLGHIFAEECDVRWFEEPVSSDDLDGLRLLRNTMGDRMEVAAGEYAWDSLYLKRMVDAGAVDVIQADATRCGGITGFLDAASLATMTPLPLSAHCAPTAHLHLGCAARALRHLEYFHDHVRIESMFFDGFRAAKNGTMAPDLSRHGMGVSFKAIDAERFRDDL